MRGAGFVTKRNSDRVLLISNLFNIHNNFLIVHQSALGALRLEQYHIVYFIVKWPLCFMFFFKNHETLTLLMVTCYCLNFMKTIVFMKITPKNEKSRYLSRKTRKFDEISLPYTPPPPKHTKSS